MNFMEGTLITLLLIAIAAIVWGWDNYVRIIPLSSDKSGLFKTAKQFENSAWFEQIEERGGMTRKEWTDFVDRHFNPPKRSD